MTITLPITKARQNLPKLVEGAQKKGDEYNITVNGYPAATIVSNDYLESLKETLEILSDKKLMADIRAAEKEIEQGKFYDWEDVKKELGFDVQNNLNSKSKKKIKRNK